MNMFMTTTNRKSGFTLVELLATIAIMAVLIVAALPYVADYTTWAREVARDRDAQVVASAMARWIAVGGATSGWEGVTASGDTKTGHLMYGVIDDLITGTEVVSGSGNTDPFLAPNTDIAALLSNISMTFTDSRDYTVFGRP